MFDNNTWDKFYDLVTNRLWQPRYIAIFLLFSGGLVAIFAGGFLAYSQLKEENVVEKCQYDQSLSGQNEEISASLSKSLAIDINGAVANPGLYELQANSRYLDAIEKAGGITSRASKSFIARKLNVSKTITDQEKIYIPFEGEEAFNTQVGEKKVSINSGSFTELQTLVGVGEVMANKIISSRPYTKIEDLTKIVGEKIVENNQSLLTL